jgi:hypothetical protein
MDFFSQVKLINQRVYQLLEIILAQRLNGKNRAAKFFLSGNFTSARLLAPAFGIA